MSKLSKMTGLPVLLIGLIGLVFAGCSGEEETVSDEFQKYVGIYSANFGPFQNAEFKILVQEGKLAIDVPGQDTYELREPNDEGVRKFVATSMAGVSFRENSETGKVEALLLHQQSVVPKGPDSVQNIPPKAPEKYKPYLGKYVIAMVNQSFELFMQEDRMVVKAPDNSIINLEEPDDKGHWYFEGDNTIALSFEFDSTGTANKIVLNRIFTILKGKSAAAEVEKIIDEAGIEAAVTRYRELKGSASEDYAFREADFNSLGYRLLQQEKFAEAIEIFKLNVEANPESSNAYDSLAEAYMKNGDIDLAIENYKKAVELNPDNQNARDMIEQLESQG